MSTCSATWNKNWALSKHSENGKTRDLVAAAQAGCEHSLRVLLERMRPIVYRKVLEVLRDTLQAEDTTQDVLVRIVRGLPGYAPTHTFRSWVLIIARNEAINVYRKRQRKPVPCSLDGDEQHRFIANVPSPERGAHQQLERQESYADLWRQVDALRGEYAEVIRLRYEEELSYQEIADRLGLPMNTMKTRLHHAKRQLAKMMAG